MQIEAGYEFLRKEPDAPFNF